MYNVGSIDVFDFSGKMKAVAPDTPIVLLTSYSKEVWRRMQEQDRRNIDYAFCWSGSTDLIIAIIKLLEDSLNAEEDIPLPGDPGEYEWLLNAGEDLEPPAFTALMDKICVRIQNNTELVNYYLALPMRRSTY